VQRFRANDRELPGAVDGERATARHLEVIQRWSKEKIDTASDQHDRRSVSSIDERTTTRNDEICR